MKRLLFLLFVFVFMSVTAFSYYKVTISNPNDYNLTDYQVRIPLTKALNGDQVFDLYWTADDGLSYWQAISEYTQLSITDCDLGKCLFVESDSQSQAGTTWAWAYAKYNLGIPKGNYIIDALVYSFSRDTNIGFNDGTNWFVGGYNPGDSDYTLNIWTSSGSYPDGDTSNVIPANKWVKLIVKYKDGTITVIAPEYGKEHQASYSLSGDTFYVFIRPVGADSSVAYYRYFKVRKYADQEPTVTINETTEEIIITNPNSYNLTNFQVRVPLDKPVFDILDANDNEVPFCYEHSNGECDNKPYDIQAIWVKIQEIPANENVTLKYTEIPQYIKICADLSCSQTLNFCYEQSNGECNTTVSSIIWTKVNLTANSDTTIYIFEDTVNNAVNGDSVFDFYDDFATLDQNKWLYDSSTATVANGILHLYNSGSSAKIESLTTIINKGILEAKIKAGTEEAGYAGVRLTYSNGSWAIFMGRHAETNNIALLTYNPTSWYDNGTFNKDVWYNFKLAYDFENGAIPYAYANNTLVVSSISFASGNVGIVQIVGGGSTSTADVYADWIRIRKFADQEPTVEIQKQQKILNVDILNNGKEYTTNVNVKINIAITNDGDNYVEYYHIWSYYYYHDELICEHDLGLLKEGFSKTDNCTISVLPKEAEDTVKVSVYAGGISEWDNKIYLFSLDLYDENVTYSNYKEFSSTKYTETLDYTLKIRCGALGYNITVGAWNGKSYKITCDNSTKIINDTWAFNSEGIKDVWFYLNAVNESDSRYFGNDTFIADLNPPVIEITKPELSKYGNVASLPYEFNVSDWSVVNCSVYDDNENLANYTNIELNGTETTESGTWTPEWGWNILKVICIDLFNRSSEVTRDILKGFKIIYLKIFDEDTTDPVVANVTISGFGFNWTNSSYQNANEYIIEVPEANKYYWLDIERDVNGSEYPKRYFMVYVPDDAPVFFDAYLVKAGDSVAYSKIQVVDIYGIAMQNAFVKVTLYNSREVCSGFTDAEGIILCLFDYLKKYEIEITYNNEKMDTFITPASLIVLRFKGTTEIVIPKIFVETDPPEGWLKELPSLVNVSISTTGYSINYIKAICNNCTFEDNSTEKLWENYPHGLSFSITPKSQEFSLRLVIDYYDGKLDKTYVWRVIPVTEKEFTIKKFPATFTLLLVGIPTLIAGLLSSVVGLGVMAIMGAVAVKIGLITATQLFVVLLAGVGIYFARKWL